MKLNKKVQKAGIVCGVIMVSLIIVGKVFHVPILSAAVNDVLYPFEKGINVVTRGTGSIFAHFQKVDDLIAENKALKEQVSKLTYENTLLPQYQDRNNDLAGLLEMKNRFAAYGGTGANVIARDYGNWNKTYTLDKGKSSNVKNNSVVLADGGLAGYVSEAYYHTSKVISIIDSRSAVGAQVVRTGDVGILKGDIDLSKEGMCILQINGECEVMKGDQIVTSYLSDIYPAGILIGTVEQVLENNNDLISYAYIKPVVDFEHLQQVLIINNDKSDES